MKIIELERKIQEQAERISKSQLIPKCRDVAKQLGSVYHNHGDSDCPDYSMRDAFGNWANYKHVFSDSSMRLEYWVYHSGGEDVLVDSEGSRVFYAKEIEIVNESERLHYPHPLIVSFDEKRFEVLAYRPGRWEQTIESLYHKMTTDVPESELVDAQQRLGLVILLPQSSQP